mmetsp:Transcript_12210/g.37084  ORF Transcript_12210/g.37084 Transcript_12210/m.37084 type:complete len:207 (-) Transcript_12210:57-677(-)
MRCLCISRGASPHAHEGLRHIPGILDVQLPLPRLQLLLPRLPIAEGFLALLVVLDRVARDLLRRLRLDVVRGNLRPFALAKFLDAFQEHLVLLRFPLELLVLRAGGTLALGLVVVLRVVPNLLVGPRLHELRGDLPVLALTQLAHALDELLMLFGGPPLREPTGLVSVLHLDAPFPRFLELVALGTREPLRKGLPSHLPLTHAPSL